MCEHSAILLSRHCQRRCLFIYIYVYLNLNLNSTSLQFQLKLGSPYHILQILKIEKTSNVRRPQYSKGGISQQPLIGPYSNCKHKHSWPNYILEILKIKTTSKSLKWRWPPMENNLKCKDDLQSLENGTYVLCGN